MSSHITKRNPAIDIIRCFALLFVVALHFFLYTDFYTQPIVGKRMYLLTLLRTFSMICLPLFMIITGYLMSRKNLSKSYYSKLIYTISIYLIASVFCLIYTFLFTDKSPNAVTVIERFFNYSNAPYGWYVEMYIGLFLLCPFLNLIYSNLNSQRQKQLLVGTFLFLTSLPHVTNIFVLPTSNEFFEILPNYWVALFPFTYYFIGCYLREYKLNLSSKKIALLSVIIFLLNGSFNYYRSFGGVLRWGTWQEYGSLFMTVQAILFFAFFENLDYSKFPDWSAKFLSKISTLCFGGYLVSWIFDDICYQFLNRKVTEMPLKLNYFFVVVLIIYIGSLLLSLIVNKIYDFFTFIAKKLKKHP